MEIKTDLATLTAPPLGDDRMVGKNTVFQLNVQYSINIIKTGYL